MELGYRGHGIFESNNRIDRPILNHVLSMPFYDIYYELYMDVAPKLTNTEIFKLYAREIGSAIIGIRQISDERQRLKSKVKRYAGWSTFALLQVPIVGAAAVEALTIVGTALLPETVIGGEVGDAMTSYAVVRPFAAKIIDIAFAIKDCRVLIKDVKSGQDPASTVTLSSATLPQNLIHHYPVPAALPLPLGEADIETPSAVVNKKSDRFKLIVSRGTLITTFAVAEVVATAIVKGTTSFFDYSIPVFPLLMAAPAELLATRGSWLLARKVQKRIDGTTQRELSNKMIMKTGIFQKLAYQIAIPAMAVGMLVGEFVYEWKAVGNSQKFQTYIKSLSPGTVSNAPQSTWGKLWDDVKGVTSSAVNVASSTVKMESAAQIQEEMYLSDAEIKTRVWLPVIPFKLSPLQRQHLIYMSAWDSEAVDLLRNNSENLPNRMRAAYTAITTGDMPEPKDSKWNEMRKWTKQQKDQLLHFIP